MRAGLLRHRVMLQEPIKAQNDVGEEEIVWRDVKEVPAEVLEMRGREYLTAREVHSELTTTIRIRHRTDVTVEWRVTHGSRAYDVEHVVDLGGRRRELELLCSEVR